MSGTFAPLVRTYAGVPLLSRGCCLEGPAVELERPGPPDVGRCLDVTNADTANGTKVQLYDCNGTGAQNWVQEGNRLRNPTSTSAWTP